MIVDFRDDWLRAFFVDDVRSRNIPSDLESPLLIDDDRSGLTRAPQATISKSCAASWPNFIRSAATSNGLSFFDGIAAEAKRRASISTTTVIREVSNADDEAQAGKR